MKTSKNAFTLIELLAVIVILAIIALIATPIILGVINDAKDNSTLRSAENYLRAVNNSIASLALDNEKIEPGTYNILENGNICLGILVDKDCSGDILKVEIDGEVPISGTIIIEKGLVADLKLMYKGKDKAIIRDSNGIFVYAEDIYKKVVDNNPDYICGDLEDKEDLTQTTCYIKSIEDLVALSSLVNKKNTFEGKTVELVNNLDFNNPNSYASGKVNNALIEGVGFDPIGHGLYEKFKGIFEGNNNTIKGLYINTPDSQYRGLFGHIESALVQNLNIEGANVTGASNSSALVGKNNLGIVQNINLNNINLLSSNATAGWNGSLVGFNSGTIKNIKAKNISVEAIYHYIGGLVGDNSGTIENIQLDNVNVKTEKAYTGGLVGSNSGEIKNVKVSNINLIGDQYAGGLLGRNLGNVNNVEIENFEFNSMEDTNIGYLGGLVGYNYTPSLISNIKLSNINLKKCSNCGGLIGYNTGDSIKNIIGKNIKVVGGRNQVGGLIGQSIAGTITQIKLANIRLEGNGQVGGLIGLSRTTMLTNAKIEGNVKGTSSVGLILGSSSGDELTVQNVVAKGNIEGDIEGTSNNIGGIIGNLPSKSDVNYNVSGVYLSGNLTFNDNAYNNRSIGNKGSYSPIFKTLVSDKVTINGNKVESNDISSVDGKTLLDMGKASQSEYEAIGFEFESTDTNECYWYFDDNDELDLKIK